MRCPASVLVISILGLLWAAFQVFGFVIIAVTIAIAFNTGGPLPPTLALYHDSTFLLYTGIFSSITLLLTVVLIAGCIGSFRLRRSSPRLMLSYSVADIVLLVVSTALNLIFVLPRTLALMPPTPGISPGAMNALTIAFSLFGFLFNLSLPIIILIIYTCASVKNAFAMGGRVAESAFPVQPPV